MTHNEIVGFFKISFHTGIEEMGKENCIARKFQLDLLKMLSYTVFKTKI